MQDERLTKNQMPVDTGILDEEEKVFILDHIREKWDAISLKSKWGNPAIKAVLALVVFQLCRITAFYGLQYEKSIISSLYTFLNGDDMIFLLVMAAVAIVWFISAGIGTLLYAILLWISIGGISPSLFGIIVVLISMACVEKHSVSAAAILIPVFTISLTGEQWTELFGEEVKSPFLAHFLLTCSFGIFIALFASFASAKLVGGPTKFTGLVIFATVMFTFGQLVHIQNGKEAELLPYSETYMPVLTTGYSGATQAFSHFKGYLFVPYCKIMAVFLIIGIVFVILINLKLGKKKPQIDIRDGIAFAVVFVMLCFVPMAVRKLTGLECGFYPIPSILIQTVLAYVATRPIAARTPYMAGTVVSGARNYIFISYAHSDLSQIKPYLQILRREGYDFWYDDNIRAGTEWQDVIATNLANCTYFLAFVSKASINSDYCTKEINYATSKKKPMTAILLDNVSLPPILEMHLASLQAIQRSKYTSDEACLKATMGLEEMERCKL